MYRVLKPGGRCMVLEFSHRSVRIKRKVYDQYSFNLLPKMGKLVANDAESYRYLAESIRMHPEQEDAKGDDGKRSGFERCDYHNMTEVSSPSIEVTNCNQMSQTYFQGDHRSPDNVTASHSRAGTHMTIKPLLLGVFETALNRTGARIWMSAIFNPCGKARSRHHHDTFSDNSYPATVRLKATTTAGRIPWTRPDTTLHRIRPCHWRMGLSGAPMRSDFSVSDVEMTEI